MKFRDVFPSRQSRTPISDALQKEREERLVDHSYEGTVPVEKIPAPPKEALRHPSKSGPVRDELDDAILPHLEKIVEIITVQHPRAGDIDLRYQVGRIEVTLNFQPTITGYGYSNYLK